MPLVGTLQSPVRINAEEAIEAAFPADYFEVRYQNKGLKVKVDGHNLSFDGTPFHVITFDEAEWELRKIHIHSPAEHLLDSSSPHDFECHMIHFAKADRDMKGDKVVIGVFFRKKDGAKTPTSIIRMNDAVKSLRATSEEPKPNEDIEINPRHFLPKSLAQWFRYNGSLTSAPYSEDVHWFVMAKEIAVASEDTKELEAHAKQPARETFDLNRRLVLRNFPIKGTKSK